MSFMSLTQICVPAPMGLRIRMSKCKRKRKRRYMRKCIPGRKGCYGVRRDHPSRLAIAESVGLSLVDVLVPACLVHPALPERCRVHRDHTVLRLVRRGRPRHQRRVVGVGVGEVSA
jgi:hypothetical protein